METEERRRSGGSAKNSKKGGKCVKVRTAEEEARRREEVKERLREKLELERRALKVVERLLEDGVAEDFLVDCVKFITPANYKDTVEERFIAKLCGYPACPNKLGEIPNQRFKISTKTNRVYDITERKCFCSNFCCKASKHYELQISKTPLWLRQHESPPEVRLLKKGDGGSSGEEVLLSERRLKQEDIEDPLAAPPQDPPGSERSAAGSDLSQSSDSEQEQDFVSSVVPQRQRARVSWADLPRRTDGDGQQSEQRRTDDPDETGRAAAGGGDDASPENRPAEERSVSQGVHPNPDLPVNTPTEPSAGSKQAPNLAALSIAQVGMSQRGAARLRGLLNTRAGEAHPDSVRLSLLARLKRTLKEWCTDETLSFLHGSDHSLGSPFAGVKETQEEELDEDDLEDEDDDTAEPGAGEQDRGRSAAAPDYETLRRETERLQLRVTEFYRGTWILPEEEMKTSKVFLHEGETESKDPVLPLIDSQAQSLIQKRITVEKLSSCLRNVVGPVGLTMSDISTDLNNLVRTFRFSNTNIIHKTPEWTLIAVVLLHLLSYVSPVVQDALEVAAAAQHLKTLTEELGLQQHDLLAVVQLFKSSTS